MTDWKKVEKSRKNIEKITGKPTPFIIEEDGERVGIFENVPFEENSDVSVSKKPEKSERLVAGAKCNPKELSFSFKKFDGSKLVQDEEARFSREKDNVEKKSKNSPDSKDKKKIEKEEPTSGLNQQQSSEKASQSYNEWLKQGQAKGWLSILVVVFLGISGVFIFKELKFY